MELLKKQALWVEAECLYPQFIIILTHAKQHLETYVLEHEGGSRALVDTKTATAISWKNPAGKEYIAAKDNVHRFPKAGTVLAGEFVPEERAKKVSFDRMIFKAASETYPAIEYRADVTLRADCLEYDITIKNSGAESITVDLGLDFKLNGAKVVAIKGYTGNTDTSVSLNSWAIPVGKFKETCFYAKIVPL